MAIDAKTPQKLYTVTFDGVSLETAYTFQYALNAQMGEARAGDSIEPDQVYVQIQSPVLTIVHRETNVIPFVTGRKGTLTFKLKDSATTPVDITVTVVNCVVGSQGDAGPEHGAPGSRQIPFHITKGNLPTYT